MRANWRGRLRRLWLTRARRRSSEGLAIPTLEAERMADAQAFGAAWAIAERTSPLLWRRLLRPSDLPRELAAAREGLSRLKSRHCATGEGAPTEVAFI